MMKQYYGALDKCISFDKMTDIFQVSGAALSKKLRDLGIIS